MFKCKIKVLVITFSYSCMAEKAILWDKISEMEIFVEFLILKAPESENHIFRGWSVCASII